MAFVKKTWKDRIVQYANRRLLTKSGGEVEQVTVTRDEGTISQAGDLFDAANMNDLENRVDNAIDTLDATVSEFSDWTTSNTSFVDACDSLGIYSGIGNVLDNLKTNIGSYGDQTMSNRVDNTQGPVYFMIFGKANDNYFTGILLSYFTSQSERQPLMFAYANGDYSVKRI